MKHVLINVGETVYEQPHTTPFDQLNQRKDDGAVTDAGIGHLRETKVGVVWNLIFNKEKQMENVKNAVQAVEERDPWKHRTEGMKCRTCMWFAHKVSVEQDRKPIGRCRRHAPMMNGYPVVFATDWCGDHKLNENAV